MTPAQFIALPEFKAWQAAYGRYLRSNGANRDECAALYAGVEAKFRELFSIADDVPVHSLYMIPDGDFSGDRPWYTWHIGRADL